MPYVRRSAAGEIVAISVRPDAADLQEGAWEAVRGDEPDVVAFAHAMTQQTNPLGNSDLGLVRVLEDLIELLIDRSLIRFTDLPPAAQAKLIDRRGTRAAMQSLSLLDSDKDDVI